ncbi:uncharacterized protein ASCRUDRAFT_18549, partial [Ascoidea rubescens DSM 1968]
HSRDWQDVKLTSLIEKAKLIFIQSDISVEDAFKTLISHNLTSLPVESFKDDINCTTFDYTDLNNYLLVVLGKLKFTQSDIDQINLNNKFNSQNHITDFITMDIIKQAQRGDQIPIKYVCQLSPKNPFIKLNEDTQTLSDVVEVLGSGVHRVAIVNSDPKNPRITGILSQRRLIKYLFDNSKHFPSLETLWSMTLNELNIGSNFVISIYGDQPLIDALIKMNSDKISSIAVVDRNNNLLGNISVTDVKHVTMGSQTRLLYKSCLHFISVILNSRGLEDGKDSYPVFHVNKSTSFGRTIAKLVATKAHRLWIVQPKTHSPSFSSSSSVTAQNTIINSSLSSPIPIKPSSASSKSPTPSPSSTPNPGKSGKLIGVVSVTDILGLLARVSSNKFIDPTAARRQR